MDVSDDMLHSDIGCIDDAVGVASRTAVTPQCPH